MIAANQRPDHSTIARFRRRHQAALAELFSEVLWLCGEAGLLQSEVIAVDSTKLHANASRDQTSDYERIAKEMLAEADAVDREEDERYGEARGDELPPELSTRHGRQGWLRDAKRRLDERRAEQAKPIPRSRPERLREARRRLDEELATERAANAAYEDYRAHGRMKNGRRLGAPPKPYKAPAIPQGKINLTDPDSRLVKAIRGYIQGYNGQAVTNEQQIVIAAELALESPDFGKLEPMVATAQSELERVGVSGPPEVVLADAGYWHHDQIQEIVSRGSTVLVPPDARNRKGPRPGWLEGHYAFMRRVLDTDAGKALYRKRSAMIEPIFG